MDLDKLAGRSGAGTPTPTVAEDTPTLSLGGDWQRYAELPQGSIVAKSGSEGAEYWAPVTMTNFAMAARLAATMVGADETGREVQFDTQAAIVLYAAKELNAPIGDFEYGEFRALNPAQDEANDEALGGSETIDSRCGGLGGVSAFA